MSYFIFLTAPLMLSIVVLFQFQIFYSLSLALFVYYLISYNLFQQFLFQLCSTSFCETGFLFTYSPLTNKRWDSKVHGSALSLLHFARLYLTVLCLYSHWSPLIIWEGKVAHCWIGDGVASSVHPIRDVFFNLVYITASFRSDRLNVLGSVTVKS